MAGASMNDIKARIKSVNGTMQITKAMELVATSKLRHAKSKAESAKPYIETVSDAMDEISSFVPKGECVYTSHKEGKTLFVVIAGDRGLAGGYNANVFKLLSSLDPNRSGLCLPVGKKARDYANKHYSEVFSDILPVVDDATVGACMRVAEDICEAFSSGKIAGVCIIYTEFVSMLTQTPRKLSLLPLELKEKNSPQDPIFESDAQTLLDNIIPQYVGGMLYGAICEAAASECAARRTAMNSANKNAEEMIGSLTLKFNRARQAVITQEITEIVSGAEAL